MTVRIAVFLFGSGLCALVYQIAWLRQLRLVFGGSTAASATVVAIFMAGLGVGSYVLGRRGEKSANPLAYYAKLEVGIALAAAVSVLLIGGVRALYILAGGTESLGIVGGSVVRLMLSAVVLGVPTFLMGGTLPATVKAATAREDVGRGTLGLLYGANTLGAVTGALLTTFVLLEWVGIRQTIWLAAALNLLIAVAANAAARRQGAVAAEEEAPPDRPAREESAPVAPRQLVLVAAALVGFVFFLMELVWYRMMGPILGGSTYTFGIVLAVALAGIGLGGLAYGAFGRGRPPTLAAFVASCGLEALALAIPFALGDRLAFLAHQLRGLEAAGFAALALAWTVVTVVVVLPAALVAGYQFPLLVGLLGSGRRGVASEVGLAYAWNTAGAIAGSIAGGFGLLTLLSAPGAWRLSVWLLALVTVAFLFFARRSGRSSKKAVLGAAVAVVAVLLTMAEGPTAFWRHSGIGAGRLEAPMRSPNEIEDARRYQRRRVAWEVDGRESSVAVEQSAGYAFVVNGKSDGSARLDAPTQVMSGLVGTLLHPAPKRALVIGLGTGSSAGWMAAVPGVENVDVVELEPAILRVARDCAAVNRNVLEDDRVEIILADAREFLLTTDRSYDVIFSEPSNPYRAGIASLFTREYYRAAAERLTEDGLFVQWLQAYEVDAGVVRTAYATLHSVFPHVETWQVHKADLLLIGSRRPIAHGSERIRQRVRQEPYREALAVAWGVSGAEGLYTGFLAGPGLAAAVGGLPGEEINTDDHPIIEFGFARNVGRLGTFGDGDVAALAAARGEDRPPGSGIDLDWGLVEELRAARRVAFGQAPRQVSLSDPSAAARQRARAAYAAGDLAAAQDAWGSQEGTPRSPIDRALVAEAAAAVADEGTLALAADLAAGQPVAADAVRARFHLRAGDVDAALGSALGALTAYRSDPWPQPDLMVRFLAVLPEIGRRSPAAADSLHDALGEPFAVHVLNDKRLEARLRLQPYLSDRDRCTESFAAFEPHPPWNEVFLSNRLRCYSRAGHPLAAAATRDLAAFNEAAGTRLWHGLAPRRPPGI